MVGEFGKVMHTLLCSKWVTNKALPNRTGNAAQGYVPAWKGGEFGENGNMCMSGCSPETTTILLTGCVPIQNKTKSLKSEKKNL